MKATLEEALTQYIENPVATYDGFSDYYVCTGQFSWKVEMAFLNLS